MKMVYIQMSMQEFTRFLSETSGRVDFKVTGVEEIPRKEPLLNRPKIAKHQASATIPKQHKRWTAEDTRLVLDGMQSAQSVRQLASTLGRTQKAVRLHFQDVMRERRELEMDSRPMKMPSPMYTSEELRVTAGTVQNHEPRRS